MSHKAKKEKIPCSIEFNTPTQNHFHDFMGNWYPPNWNDSEVSNYLRQNSQESTCAGISF